MIGWRVAWKCLVAWRFGELSQQPTWPQVRHRRRCTQARADLQTLLAAERARRHVADGVDMAAFVGHQCLPVLAGSAALSPASARKACSAATTCAPSPTAAATRLIDPERTSPIAKTPGRLVSSGLPGSPSGAHEALVVERHVGAGQPGGVRVGADEQKQMADRAPDSPRPIGASASGSLPEPRPALRGR